MSGYDEYDELVDTDPLTLRDRCRTAEHDLKLTKQALWEVYVILGFDPDGDNEWHCSVADACKTAIAAAREARTDYDEALADSERVSGRG